MKTKFKLSNRILSLVLALVMIVGMVPMTTLTAYATPTEASELPVSYNGWQPTYTTYVEGLTQYFKYDGYLYQAVWKNCTATSVSLYRYDNQLRYMRNNTKWGIALCKWSTGNSAKVTVYDLPKTINEVLVAYGSASTEVNNTSNHILEITCLAVKEHSHPICGATHTDVGDHTGACSNIAWKKWESTNSMPTEAGAYYLVSDVTLSSTWEIPEGLEISLCLNGHSVSGNNAVRVVTVNKTATLNLCDCSSAQTGKITEGYRSDYSGAGVWVYTGSTLNLYGGSIVKNKTPYQGGGVYIFQGTFNMYGGSISDNTALDGAGVNNNSGTINIYAGDITKNKASRMGGGVNHNSGKFYMTGGNISQNEVTGYQQYCHGGGVYHNYGSFEMSGGTISGNSATTGAGIYVAYASKWLVSGVPIINDAIYLKSGQYGTAYITVCGDLNDKASFAATNRGVGEAIAKGTDTYFVTESDVAKFATNAGAIYVDSVGNRLVLCDDSHPEYVDGACKTCGTECEHSLVYEKGNQNEIIESCNAESNCGYEKIATLSANAEYTYTGSAITPATITYSDGWRGEKVDNSTITYDNNLNVGTATASVTLNEKTATKSFEIKAADIAGATITLNPASGTYTGNEQEPTVAVVWNVQTLTENTDYELSWDKTVFTDPDTYTVTVTGKGNFAGSKTQIFNINAANLTDVKVEQVRTLTYNGEAQTPIVSTNAVAVNNQPVTFTYSLAQDGTYDSMPTFTNAGTYTVYFKATAANHNEATGYFTVTVDKATVTEPTIASKVYNGSEQKADITDTDLYTVDENNGGTGVRQYNVVLKLKDAANYKWSSTDDAEINVKFAITRATNEWATTPSISGWTYGETAKVAVGTAKFGDVSIQYTGTANDGTQFSSMTAPTKAGNYTVTFIVAETEDYSGLETSVDFTIAKATYDMTGAKWDYSEPFKYDGKLHTVWVDENSLPDGVSVSRYTGNNGSDVGKYTANVSLVYDIYNYNQPEFNYLLEWEIKNDWTPIEYNVSTLNSNGWINGDFVITAADGYKVSLTNTADGVWEDKLTYTAETDNGSVTFYLKNETDGTISLAKTENYKLDKTTPTGRVEFVERKSWQEFVNTITFGLFFKDEVAVKAEATDALSGVESIEYAVSDKAMNLDEVKAITEWTAMPADGVAVTLEDAKLFVYFVRITDKAGNVTYLSTDGAEYDTTAPVISGIENGKTYYTTQKVTVTEKNIASITLNGENAGNEITLDGNKEATYTIVVTDKAGNSSTVSVTMKPISNLSAPIDTLDKDNVNSGNEQAVDGVKAAVAAVDTTNATEEEKAALKEITDKVAELEKVIDDTKAEIARINEELNKYDGNTVNSDDAAALEQLRKDIKALTDGGNLTDAERTALTEDASDVVAMQKTVSDTVAENNRISGAVDSYDLATVTSDDKEDLEQLLADIEDQLESTNLTDEEISELNGDKKAVEDLLTKIKGTDELIDKLTGDVDGYSDDTVKSTDKDAIEQIIEDIDALLETENLTEDEKKALEDVKEKAEGLLDAIEDAAKAPNTENTEKVKDITTENVTPENKTDLENAKADLEKALEDNGGNYTEDEKKAIEDEIKKIGEALEVIGNVEAVEELIGKLPENITKNDEDAIKAADDALGALSDYEKSLVDEDAKKALDDAKAALTTLNKPADPNSPQTGDNSNIWWWFALLFVSGTGMFGITLYDRKRKVATK